MGDAVINLKTDGALLQALSKATQATLTHDQLLDQRVSFVLGSMKPNSITRERVKEILLQQEGGKPAK